MHVYLVPVGGDRHDLYCEVPVDELSDSDDAPASSRSWWRTRLDRFWQTLAAAEEDRRRRERGEAIESRGLWRWMMRRIAEAIAEQRLLWILRTTDAAVLVYPADQSAARALEITKAMLRRDFEEHRRWLVIDTAILVLCLPLTIIPGPNVPSLFFSFRAIGHFLSLRGARRGVRLVTWEPLASVELAEVRAALSLPVGLRRERLDALSAALGLERMGAFVERVTE